MCRTAMLVLVCALCMEHSAQLVIYLSGRRGGGGLCVGKNVQGKNVWRFCVPYFPLFLRIEVDKD